MADAAGRSSSNDKEYKDFLNDLVKLNHALRGEISMTGYVAMHVIGTMCRYVLLGDMFRP